MSRISSPRFVGRAEELARLDGALADAAPRVLLLGGEAGVGKTRLLAEFTARARSAGARVLTGGCLQVGEGTLAYAPISQALRQVVRQLDPAALEQVVGAWRPELGRLVPELGPPEPSEQAAGELARTRLFEGLLSLVERLAAERPLVLTIEDLHWADRSTLDLLSYLVANLAEAAVVLVGSYRSDELHRRHPLRPVLADLDRHATVERLELGRLNREELGAVLAGILGGPPAPQLLDSVLARSEGNPFFAEELLAAELSGGSTTLLPASLHDLLAARIDALSGPAQRVLRVAAVAGRRVGHELLAAACPLAEPTLLEAVREAVEHQVLVADPADDAYAFRHALLGEVVDADLLPGEHRQLHAALAHSLAAHAELAGGTPAEAAAELAVHWYESHDLARALPAAVAAGVAATQSLAFAEAKRHFERALDLWDLAPDVAAGLPQDRVTVLEWASEAAHQAGDQQRAAALARAALASLDATAEPMRAALLVEELGHYLSASGSDEALDVYQEAVALLPDGPSAVRARVLAGQAGALLMASRVRAARASAEEALRVAQSTGARQQEGFALLALGSALDALGEREVALARVREARQIAEELGDFDILGGAVVLLAQLLDTAGQLTEALESMAEPRRLGIGSSWDQTLAAHAGDLCFRLGRWDDADRLLRRALTTAVMPGMHALNARLGRAKFEIERGQVDAAAQLLDEAERSGAHVRTPEYTGYFEGRAVLAIWQDRLDDARAAVHQSLEWLAGAEHEHWFRALLTLGLRAEADRAEQARARRRPAEADAARQVGTALLARLRQLVDRSAAPAPETAAHAALGEAEATRLDGKSDPERWAAAAAAWDQLGQPYPAAYARWRQAEALLTRSGSRPGATAVLRTAYETAKQLGAPPLRREVEGLARRARIDLEPPATDQPAPAPPADPYGLTPREREVLALLADGRSNPQIAQALFISAKTAGIQVSNILAKLGVTSRGEAAAIAHRGGLVD
jgi:DNA-binding CsgD family transcriptional regulator/tetratricopeptide (TPR) repeat protein